MIAILGATSKLAQDYITRFSRRCEAPLALYARRPEAVETFLAEQGLSSRHLVGPIDDFTSRAHDGVINFIGVGDPARAKEMGAGIFDATLASDQMVLDSLTRHPQTPYVFLSSGAAYGAVFAEPVDEKTAASFPINSIEPQHYYGIAKFHAEARHRGCADRTIIDVRVFNYVSRTMDLGTRFLLADMVNAILLSEPFKTDDTHIVRDFIHPDDLGALLDACLAAPSGSNFAVDAYSQAPISKVDLMRLLGERFGLRSEVAPIDMVNATGAKRVYYSLSRRAAALGYSPRHSSASGILEELGSLLDS